MRFCLPRRHRRPLLFPPGLLALAGLLWLGGVALGPWQHILTRKSVLQLTIPPRSSSDTITPHINGAFSQRTLKKGTGLILYSQLHTNQIYAWRDVKLNGNSRHDSSAINSVAAATVSMRNDKQQNGGIRVKFAPDASYNSFVRMVDLMGILQQKKYLFDIAHGPVVLYVLVDDVGVYERNKNWFSCGTNSLQGALVMHIRSHTVTREWLANPQNFVHSKWRNILVLFATIATLSFWRIIRP